MHARTMHEALFQTRGIHHIARFPCGHMGLVEAESSGNQYLNGTATTSPPLVLLVLPLLLMPRGTLWHADAQRSPHHDHREAKA